MSKSTIGTPRPAKKLPAGRWHGSAATGRYWEGGCTCGSGREGRELYDGRGIYCGITCDVCKKENKYQPFIMADYYSQADVDEQIEEDK